MQPWLIVLLVILAVLIAGTIVLYIVGNRMQKKQDEAAAKMEIGKQTVTMLVIDKKRMPIKEAGLPSIVLESTPKYLRRSKVPVVKAKIGPKILTMICDEKIFDIVPVKKEIKAVINGIYIMDVKGLHAPLPQEQPKKGFRAKLRGWAASKLAASRSTGADSKKNTGKNSKKK